MSNMSPYAHRVILVPYDATFDGESLCPFHPLLYAGG